MKLQTLTTIAFIIPTFAIAQDSASGISGIIVPEGQTRVLDSAEQTLILGSLVMEDNSTIVIPADWDFWNVKIAELTVGDNAQILSKRPVITEAPQTPPQRASNGKCRRKGETAAGGFSGEVGPVGLTGAHIQIEAGIKAIGSLTIFSNGGDGGETGLGGQGANGARASCNNRCGGQNGGKGGRSEGTDGGAGGLIELRYYEANGSDIGDLDEIIAGIRFDVEGGFAGPLPRSAPGGAPGPGKSCKRPPLKNLWRTPGNPGLWGDVAIGSDGSDGTVITTNLDVIRAELQVKGLEATEIENYIRMSAETFE